MPQLEDFEPRPGSHHREPRRRPATHGGPSPKPRSGKGRRPRSRAKPRGRFEGQFSDPPSKPTASRVRNREQESKTSLLGTSYLVTAAGQRFNELTRMHTVYPLVERMLDETHGWIQTFELYDNGPYVPKTRVNGIRYRPGGPLALYKCRVPGLEVQAQGTYFGSDFRPFGGFAEVYEGGFVPANWSHGYSMLDFTNAGQLGPFDSSYESAAPYGATAYNRYKPKTSFTNLFVSLGETKDLPGLMRTTSRGMAQAYRAFLSRSLSPRSRRAALRELFMPEELGNQFLNEQFGWAPFYSDMEKLGKAYHTFDRRYAEVQRNQGNWIKRGGTVLQVREDGPVTVVNGSGVVFPALTGGFYSTSSSMFATSRLYTTVERKVWFEGSFKYYIPRFAPDDSDRGRYGRITDLMRHYGLMVSPQAVWELTPWSWLVDWFSNAGDVISNLSTLLTDSLVSRYAYVMCHSKRHVVNDSTIRLNGGDKHCFWYQEIETKKRDSANPYGFGLTDGDLTVRQLAILAALGLTRR